MRSASAFWSSAIPCQLHIAVQLHFVGLARPPRGACHEVLHNHSFPKEALRRVMIRGRLPQKPVSWKCNVLFFVTKSLSCH